MISIIDSHRQGPVLRAGLFGLTALLMSGLLWEQFQLGLYNTVLASIYVIPVLVLAAVVILFSRDRSHHDWLVLPVLVLVTIPGLVRLETGVALSLNYLLMMPFLSYFCLRRTLGHIYNFCMVVAIWIATLAVSDLLVATRSALVYIMVAASVACYGLLISHRLLVATSLALKDGESGAYNARQFALMLEREVARSVRAKRPLSLIGFSIEDFSQLCDLHGNRAVIQFLPDFVGCIRDEVRAGDEVFRIREELFILLLPDCAEDGAIVLMERIRRHLEQRHWPVLGEVSLLTATVALAAGEKGRDVERRLLTRLAKQKRASLQASAF
ncbi:GGDEF domain-containing protein [Candidatus Thalassolituus haligoni]|jgi:diguanylate cyclase (GGDEF)-like protein|uniref:GGDEF domain-containing protein n=1 Tax=Candidatus Thalassolituus haligoni TaxID=3100113 RepID=UPI003519170C|tara:strand:+ start:6686 stop:7666 length:981 start_codon:yes stop_codon:yes gene_type:complete